MICCTLHDKELQWLCETQRYASCQNGSKSAKGIDDHGGSKMAIVARDGVDGKVCSNCKEWQPVSEFSRQAFSKDGYQSWCKVCIRENSRRHYKKNREKMQRYR